LQAAAFTAEFAEDAEIFDLDFSSAVSAFSAVSKGVCAFYLTARVGAFEGRR
jgi:hypothetical protein